jgi:hypothetical protein
VHYTAKVCVENPSNNTSNLVVPNQTFTVTNTSNLNPTNATQIQNPNIGTPQPLLIFPITLVPGQRRCFWVEFSRPIGEQQSAFHLKYHEEGFPDLETDIPDTANLPSCICKTCSEDYIIQGNKNESITAVKYTPTDGSSIFQIAADFILPTASPIKEIKAEVISVQHEVNDPQCHTCTKNHSRMGMIFDKGNNLIVGTNPWVNNIGTLNNVVGDPPGGGNTQYSNEIKWSAQDTAIGVNMNSNNTRIITALAMPQLSTLDCCHSKFKVCIRYTFTDIDCIACDKVVCYEIDTSQTGSNNDPNDVINDEQNSSNINTILTPQN